MKKHKEIQLDDPEIAAIEGDDDPNVISKSQRKRDMIALQDIGEELVKFSPETIRKFDLPEELLVALLDAKKIAPSKHGGRKRQMQYIGRLMRNVEAEPIIKQLDELRAPSDKQTALMHLSEQWRDRMLESADALALFMNDFAEVDHPLMLRYIEKAKDERTKQKPPKHYRFLYQEIHRLVLQKAEIHIATDEHR